MTSPNGNAVGGDVESSATARELLSFGAHALHILENNLGMLENLQETFSNIVAIARGGVQQSRLPEASRS